MPDVEWCAGSNRPEVLSLCTHRSFWAGRMSTDGEEGLGEVVPSGRNVACSSSSNCRLLALQLTNSSRLMGRECTAKNLGVHQFEQLYELAGKSALIDVDPPST